MADAAKHHCHWPGCTVEVPPVLWGCKPHWFSLPRHLRDEIWRTYRRGQEITKSPSAEYIAAAKAVQDWIAAYRSSQRGLGHQPMDPKRRAPTSGVETSLKGGE